MQYLRSILVFGAIVSFGTSSGDSVYPKFAHVFEDPAKSDLLYSAASGPLEETHTFTRSLLLRTVVLPSQIVVCAGQDTYQEDITVKITQKTLTNGQVAEVATGRFTGEARSGQELHVPVGFGPDFQPPTIGTYIDAYRGYLYVFNITFNSTGIYPWYKARRFSTSGSLRTASDGAGYMIGLSYTLV